MISLTNSLVISLVILRAMVRIVALWAASVVVLGIALVVVPEIDLCIALGIALWVDRAWIVAMFVAAACVLW